MFKTLIAFILFSYSWVHSAAQVPSQLMFSRLTKEDGLASNTTFQTVRDKRGFLWIATQNGLQRYDGHRFMTFRHIPGDTTSVTKNSISHLFLDSKDRLWLLFDNQLGYFNINSFKFRATSISVPVMMLREAMEDKEGRIILFADNKLFLFDEQDNAFHQNYPLPALPPGMSLSDLAIDQSGAYWFTGKQGSVLVDPSTRQVQPPSSTPRDSLFKVKNARYPFISKENTWWLVSWLPFSGSAPVLFSYDARSDKLQRYEKIRPYAAADSYYEIWNVFQQKNGTIWIHGMGLLAYFDPAKNKFIHLPSNPFQRNGLDYDMVSHLHEDKQGNVWVSTNKGLYRFNIEAQVFQSRRNIRHNDTSIVSNAVSKVIQTKNNEIWVGTWGAGIFSYNEQLQPIPNPVTQSMPAGKTFHPSAMVERRNGDIWIGTQTGELKIYQPSSGRTHSIAPTLLKGQTITQIVEDLKGNLWMGTSTGLLVKCINGNWADTSNAYKAVLTDIADVMKLYVDRRGHLWVCTASAGVYELDAGNDGTVHHILGGADNKKGLLTDGATDVLQYDDSTFLFASEGLCILHYPSQTFRYLVPADGLPAEHITNLVLDKRNRLWVAADGNLYRLNLDNKLSITYGADDGIVNNVFQVGSATTLRDGRIIIGTPKDFVVFDPEATVSDKNVPTPAITGFELGSRMLPVDSLMSLEEFKLAHDNTFVRIELSTLSFPGDYYIYYMLEGLDKSWKSVYNNEIIYQYIPPGDYTLKLKARNGDGMESKEVIGLRISVNPPFWKTWWFFGLLILVMGGLLFLLDRERIKRKTALMKMRSNIADGLHQDINATLGNITILSEMARMKADREPEKSKEFIQQIHTKSQNMAQAMEDILWSIDPRNDSMQSFMLRFREYIDSLKSKYDVSITLDVDNNVEKLQLPMRKRNEVFWIFKSGITNVTRTGGKNCLIQIMLRRSDLVYVLSYDASAMDREAMNNLRQRGELHSRLESLNADLQFQEGKEHSVFILTIPLKS